MGLASNTTEDQTSPEDENGEPLSGEAYDLAAQAMRRDGFFLRLVGHVVKRMNDAGLRNFNGDLPGGLSAQDIAMTVVEKAVGGLFTWDREKCPDFEKFCHSRIWSTLSNYKKRQLLIQAASPVPGENGGSGEMQETEISGAADPIDIYHALCARDGRNLGDSFLQDFALSLPDGSLEQKIAIAVLDNRDCSTRKDCISKLQVTERDFDAAQKRLERKLTPFQADWLKDNKLTMTEWREAQ